MSKERLGEMDQLLSDYYEDIDDPFATTDNAMAIIDKVGSLIDFAKEQAERVQELEKEINETKDKWNIDAAKWAIVIGALKEQNKRYHETIESMKSEIKYALHSHKSKDVKRHYLENAVRYADEASGGRSK